MKNFLLCIVFSFFLISCSVDSDLEKSEIATNASTETTNFNIPKNKANSFDSAGMKYYNALNTYLQNNQRPNSIKEIADQIKFTSKYYSASQLTDRNAIFFTDEIVEAIMADPDNIMIAIVNGSTLSAQAKTTLINFLQNLILHREEQFTIIYGYIVSYESTIIPNTTFSEDEKETILTVASISRYSLYSEAERKDRDWETSVGSKSVKPFFAKNEAATISIIALLGKII